MYSKIAVAGHPIHPMLVAFPVAFYAASLAGFAVYAANGHQFWLNLAIAGAIAGSGSAIVAALPGMIDWLFGIPRQSQAKILGLTHGGLNVTALGLFIATAVLYVGNWNGPSADATLGLALTAAGVAVTIAAGALGWTLVQTFHVGVSLTDEQRRDEDIVHMHTCRMRMPHRRAS
ncbi:DUF2231 domain-containing protein [Skermania sp. ID1734]|uniref:DUF2231 domain-containing protein n=1 Tax=Skermania sp. ID1734 TaxID=2597516 RepID=UPI00117DC6D7|nr:DUF2231 domain-containing protein [Skermania sp. ID1734]TSE00614.1 DUF2231 domain-containing protein [Skermania sp. ID1734]